MYSNGIITAPVSIDDVKSALGVSTNDVAALCTSSKINMWSRKKPIRLAQNFPDINGDWYKGDSVGNDYVYGIECYGIRKAAIDITGVTITQNAFYRRHFAIDANVYLNHPSGGSSSPYRLGDFIGYNGNTPSYDKVGSIPYGARNIAVLTSSGGISFSTLLSYSYSGKGDFIGLGELFGTDKGGDLYVGIIAEAASNAMNAPTGSGDNKRTSPLTIVYRGTKIDGTVNSTTGLDYVAMCTTPNYSMSSNNPSETNNYFSNNEYIKVVTGIIKQGTNKTYFFPLDSLWVAPNGKVDSSTYAYLSSAYAYISITKDGSSGQYWAYIAKYDDLYMRVVAPNEGNSVLMFGTPIGISAADSTISIQKNITGLPMIAGSKARTTTVYASGISGWSATSPTNALAIKFKFNGSGSTVKLSFGFSIAKSGGGYNSYMKTVSISLPSGSNVSKSSKITLI